MDTYDLVTAYGGVPDDHEPMNVDDPTTPPGGDPVTWQGSGELVEDLAWKMDTDAQRTHKPGKGAGTTISDAETAVRFHINDRGLDDEYIVNRFRHPHFSWIVEEVGKSQDVILFLSFTQFCNQQWRFLGGHAVTVAGVEPAGGAPAITQSTDQICVSDPFLDMAEAGSTGRVHDGILVPHDPPPHAADTHNDAGNLSHDCYPVVNMPSPYGVVSIPNYANIVEPGGPTPETDCEQVANFVSQNLWDPNRPEFEPSPCDPGCGPVITQVSYALEISPFFWKAGGWIDYAPSGIPDFDQRQGRFVCPVNQSFSYCGPTALANSFWWFDSKFEPSPVPPPTINDNYPLVQPLGGGDDHDAGNVDLLITDLGIALNTDNQRSVHPDPFCGTLLEDMANGISDWLLATALNNDYYVRVARAPSFDQVAAEIEKSQDVILLLGFWQLQDEAWVRVGGHYVTSSGVDSGNRLIAFSDPIQDATEDGSTPGRVLGVVPHSHPAAPPPDTIHHDAQNISHDVYAAVPTVSPGGIWGPEGYADVLGPVGLQNFLDQNSSLELSEIHPSGPPSGSAPIVTEVEFMVEVSPCPPDMDGDTYRPFCDLDCDDTDGNVYPGAPQICDGKNNDCLDPTWPVLPADETDDDLDGLSECDGDCDDTDGGIWETPGEVQALTLDHNTGTGITTLHWSSPASPGCLVPLYDSLRSPAPDDFGAVAFCVESDDGSDTTATENATPGANTVRYILIRAEDACPVGEGSLGQDSDGMPRPAGRSCP